MARKETKTWETEKAPFATRLSEIMKERKISQEKLASELGVKRQTVSLYKTGQSSPNTEQLCKIAKFFDISADWLLGLSDVKSINLDIKIINELTGLNEDAVNSLIKFAQVSSMVCPEFVNPTTRAINQLLSTESGKTILFKMNRLGLFRQEYSASANTKIKNLENFLKENNISEDDAFPYVGDIRKELFSMEKNESYERFDVIESFIKLLDELYPAVNWKSYRNTCDMLDGMEDKEAFNCG